MGLILQVVVLKEVHHLLDHHHETALHCESADAHLHGSEYAPADCVICFFHFAPAQLTFCELLLDFPTIRVVQPCFFYQNPLSKKVDWHWFLRGPPAVAA